MLGKSSSRWPLHDTADLPQEEERGEKKKSRERFQATRCLQSPTPYLIDLKLKFVSKGYSPQNLEGLLFLSNISAFFQALYVTGCYKNKFFCVCTGSSI